MKAITGLVILVEDDADVRESTTQTLRIGGFDVMPFASGATALKYISPSFEGVVVSDVCMPRLDGHELLNQVREIDSEIPVIFITGHSEIRQAVDAVLKGAHDYIEKPFQPDHLTSSISRALWARSNVLEGRTLRAAIDGAELAEVLSGPSKRIARLREEVAQVAATNSDVLVLGETGSGKGRVALAIHLAGERSRKPFVTLNCGAVSDASIETELFGAESGAVPGAYRRREGRAATADTGALLLDDVDYASPSMQNFLHALLSTRTIRALGANEDVRVDFRAISTARPDLIDRVQRGEFRNDLFYCLDVVTLTVPPLRERLEDVPELFASLLKQAEERFGRKLDKVSDGVRRRLTDYHWPGNMRELATFAERVVLGFDEEQQDDSQHLPLPQRMEMFERSTIVDTLAAAGGDVRTTVKALGIPRKTFYDKLVRHGINLAEFRPPRGGA